MAVDPTTIGRLIYAARLVRSERATLLQAHGVHVGQDLLLHHLQAQDGATMGALAEALGVRPPTVTKMVNRMAQQGLVRRETSRYDSRQNHVFLEPGGAALIGDIEAVWRTAEDIALEGLREKDVKRLRKLLGRIVDNLDGRARPDETDD